MSTLDKFANRKEEVRTGQRGDLRRVLQKELDDAIERTVIQIYGTGADEILGSIPSRSLDSAYLSISNVIEKLARGQ